MGSVVVNIEQCYGEFNKGLSYKDEESFGHGNLVIISEDAPIVIFFSSFFAVKPFAEVLV